MLAPSLPSLHLLFLFRWLMPVFPSLLDSLQREPPIPLKVPFSLVLMADRLWPHSLSAAACPHCVLLSESSVWVEDRLALEKWMPDMDAWAGGVSLSLSPSLSHQAKLSSTCNSRLPYASFFAEGETGERHGLRVLVALGCLFNSWGS